MSREQDAPTGEQIRALWAAGRIEEARRALVEMAGQSVYRFVKAMVRDEHLAQDLAQDTFLRAFQSLGSYRGEAEVTTWVLAIGRRLVLSRARRSRLERRWQVVTDAPPDAVGGRGIVEPADPKLMDAVAALPLRQREAVVLFYLEDLGVEDIARLTGRPANTIKSDLHRARAALRLELGEAPRSPAGGEPGAEASHE